VRHRLRCASITVTGVLSVTRWATAPPRPGPGSMAWPDRGVNDVSGRQRIERLERAAVSTNWPKVAAAESEFAGVKLLLAEVREPGRVARGKRMPQ
jgi:hypothetical protein